MLKSSGKSNQDSDERRKERRKALNHKFLKCTSKQYPFSPNRMKDYRTSNRRIYYTYSTSDDDNSKLKSKGQVYLKAEDVLHIPGLGFDGLVGYSPMAMACEDYGAKFFANCANPSGILEHPGTLKDPEKLRENWHLLFKF